MRAADFTLLLTQLTQLSHRQRDKLGRTLHQTTAQDQVVALIDAATAVHPSCPHCQSARCHRHGRADALQRFRCTVCRKTFNGLTGTPLARLRHKDKWLAYAECLLVSSSVRAAATEIGIDKNTSFRWRHRFLTLPGADRPPYLHGITEADEMYLLESEKGARHLQRRPRRRGGAATKRGISGEQVCILVARDRTGQTRDFVTGKGALTTAQLRTHLTPVIDHDILLVTDAHAAYRSFAREMGISHQSVNLSRGVRVAGAVHVQNVNAYHRRFRQWLARFNGVASRYLGNYLGWRWALDAGRIGSPETLFSAAIGVFPHFAVT